MWYFQEVYESNVHNRRILAVKVITGRPQRTPPGLPVSRKKMQEERQHR